MKRKDAPQISESAASMRTFRRPTPPYNARGRPSVSPARMNHLTALAEQPLHRALGLTDWEAGRIRELLGRDPNHFELAVFSLLWSEHCGYKHSAPLLKRLPSTGERVLQGPGENAGVLDLGDRTAVAFKVESHNHPSAVEPFQGAATGIGGILRDVIAMGARPIALLDGLWFGEPDFHFQQAVAGIGHYGNCVGVPTVGGETVFDPAYASNCLVNAMCVGLLDAGRLRSAKASGAGKIVVLYGATTGRDGIGGASVLASAELSEDDADKRPSVQVGDPFTGKKLIEVSLELVESGLVESLQDCGAAGLASALSEMASGSVGIDVHLDRVPLREEGMEPWEIMISESQERMVAVVRPEMLDAVHDVCARWELPCTAIGEVTDSGALRAFQDGSIVGDIPAELLTDECPRYEVEQRDEPRAPRRPEPPAFAVGEVIEQYDHLVGSRTVRRPGLDAAVLRLRPSLRGLAVALQGPAPGETDGFRAGVQATLGAARNDADGASIPPTPVVGCVGLVPDVRRVPGRWRSGDAVLLATSPDGSLAAEAALIRFLWKAAPHLSLCHDVGASGIAGALAEAAAWSGGLEAEVEIPEDYDSRRGAAILACRPGRIGRLGSRGFVEIGVIA